MDTGDGEASSTECPGEPTTVLFPRAIFDEMIAHVVASLPAEGCGLLAVCTSGAMTTAARFFPGTNIEGSPTRYTMEPGEVLAALLEIDRRGWRLGATVHSHPSGPATPSRTDLTEARYPDALLAIIGLATHPPELRLWRLPGDQGLESVEVGYRMTEGASPVR